MSASDGLAVQDASTVDVSKLTPLTPEVISRQATINIGTIGHVAHGKSTVVKAISGVQTVRFKHEKERNITIKLGYANAKLYKCESGKCEAPAAFFSFGSSKEDKPPCPTCSESLTLKRHVSFVDCPGHDILMATMLNGAAVMDAALLLVAANEKCPQPQTFEHLAAVEIMRLNHLIVLQNKVELIQEAQALSQHEDIKQLVAGTSAAEAPIVPVSAVFKYNMDVVVEYLCSHIPVPLRDFTSSPQMIIIRSFDVNKPGDDVENLKGGVAGGSILKGVIRVGDEIEVRPGVVSKSSDGKHTCSPIRSKVVSLYTENNALQFAVPGGLIGVGTTIDPTLTRSDRLVGQVLGHPGCLPDVFVEIDVKYYLLKRLLGVKSEGLEKAGKVSHLRKGEFLMINIGSTSAGGRLISVKDEVARVELSLPVCTRIGDKTALSRKVEKHWRLIGWGQIVTGKTLTLPSSQ